MNAGNFFEKMTIMRICGTSMKAMKVSKALMKTYILSGRIY